MKSILVLASFPESGMAWIAKHADSLRDWCVVCNKLELKQVLTTQFYNANTTEFIDVEGYILPEFKNNPERALMIAALVNHKRRVSPICSAKFIVKSLNKTNIDLLMLDASMLAKAGMYPR